MSSFFFVMENKKLERKSDNHAFIGKWNIYEMNLWDEKYLNKEKQSAIKISSNNKGAFILGSIKSRFAGYVGNLGQQERFFFTWGNPDRQSLSGSGWIESLNDDEIKGEIIFHHGNSSTFKARKSFKDKEKESINTLVKLAEKTFAMNPLPPVSEADEILFRAFITGGAADYSKSDKTQEVNYENGESYGERRILYAEKIEWLLNNKEAKKLKEGQEFGEIYELKIIGAKIEPYILKDHGLHLANININFSLIFEVCHFNCFVNLTQAKLKDLIIKQSYIDGKKEIKSEKRTASLMAYGIDIQGNLTLGNNLITRSNIVFCNSVIQGYLSCKDINIIEESEIVYFGSDILSKKSERNFTIYPTLDFSSSIIELFANLTRLFLYEQAGIISFKESIIKSYFLINDCRLKNEKDSSLKLRGIHVDETIGLDQIDIIGAIDLSFAKIKNIAIKGNIKSGNIKYSKLPQKYAMVAEDINVAESIELINLKTTGLLSISNASIGRSIEFSSGCIIKNDDNNNHDYVTFELSCTNVKQDLIVNEDTQLEGFMNFNRSKVEGTFSLLNNNSKNRISLVYTDVGILKIDTDSFPKHEKLFLDHFSYDSIHPYTFGVINNQFLIENFLRAQYNGELLVPFSPQPYEQLAEVLINSGREEEATKVLIAKQGDLRQFGNLGCWRTLVNIVLAGTIRHGYRPYVALIWSAGFIVLGTVVFEYGKQQNLMFPTKANPHVTIQQQKKIKESFNTSDFVPYVDIQQSQESDAAKFDYSEFVPLVYSIDSFIPIVDLNQKAYWIPKYNSKGLRWYLWIHVALGWIFTSLWVAGFTGLVRRSK